MEAIARRRGFIARKNEVDFDRTSSAIIDEFKNGIIGRIAFDLP
jgi:ribosome biogenesis GTPase A